MIEPGLRHTSSLLVTKQHTVPALTGALPSFATLPDVFATAYLVGFVEATCVDAIAPSLTEGQSSVGTLVELSHVAATPSGMTVTAQVELLEVDGRRLRFAVECHDDRDLIGSGYHERFVIDLAKFEARIARKAGG